VLVVWWSGPHTKSTDIDFILWNLTINQTTLETLLTLIHDIQVRTKIALQVYFDKNNRVRKVNAFNGTIAPEIL